MSKHKAICATAVGFAASAALTTLYLPTAAAHAPKSLDHDKISEIIHVSHLDSNAPKIQIRLPKSGSTKQFRGTITFTNDTDYNVTLRLKKAIRLSNTNVPRSLNLAKRASKKISFTGSLNARNGYTSAGLIYVSSMGGISTGLVNIQVKNGKFRPVKAGSFGLNDPGSAAIKVPGNARIQPGIRGYKRFLKGGHTFGKLNKAMRGKTRQSSPVKTKYDVPNVAPGGSWTNFRNQNLGNPQLINRSVDDWNPKAFIGQVFNNIFSIFAPKAAAANGVYKGRFVFRTIDSSDMFFPAVGIGVKAVKATDSCTHNSPLAKTFADGNGNFQFTINTNSSYKICYFPESSFLKIGRQLDSNQYIWADPPRNTIPNARVTRQPVRHDGVFDIWFEAMAFQTSMTDAGIDPVRTGNKRIRVKFPSEANDCGPGPAWSCASKNGGLWIATQHAVRHGTMSHELAHQVDNKYTVDVGIARPPGIGGSHTFYGCYHPNNRRGMIVTEGWANYEMARALGSRNASRYTNTFRADIANDWIDGINFDSNGTDCSNNAVSGVNGSESTVATILWDFYDISNDNSDTLHYVSPHYITNMYLKNHPTDSAKVLNERIMKDCKANINKNVTNDGQICDNIFSQNGGSD